MTISDGDLRGAIRTATGAHREWSEKRDVGRVASLCGGSAAALGTAEELADILVAEMGKPVGKRGGAVDLARRSTSYADNAEALMARRAGSGSPKVRAVAVDPPQSSAPAGGYAWARSRTYRLRAFAARNLIIGTRSLKHAPQCPCSRLRRWRMLFADGLHDGASEHLRDERADRVGDRRPAQSRRVRHRLRTSRCRRRVARRPEI